MMRRIIVSASGYYAWVDRPLSKRAQEEVRLELEIRAAHQRNRQTYGPERFQRDLAEHGVRVGVCRIKRIRQKLGIRCKQKRRFKTTTNSAHRLPVADNLLGQQFKVSQPNAVWVSGRVRRHHHGLGQFGITYSDRAPLHIAPRSTEILWSALA